MARIITDQTHEQDRKVLADLRRQIKELEAFKAAFPPVSDGKIARRMVEDRAWAERDEARGRLKALGNRHRQGERFDMCVRCGTEWPCYDYRLATGKGEG